MKKIIVIGAFGCGNQGDDAILEGITRNLEDEFEIIPTIGKYDSIKKGYKRYLSCRLCEGISIPVIFNMILFVISYIFTVIRSGAVIIGGGQLIHELTSYNLKFYFLLQKIAEIFGKKVYYFGIGAGPFKTKKASDRLALCMNRCGGVYTRTPGDAGLLTDIGVKKVKASADIVFSFENNVQKGDRLRTNGARHKTNSARHQLITGEYIIVNICKWFHSDNIFRQDSMDFRTEKKLFCDSARILHEMTGKQIALLPTVACDEPVAAEIAEMLKAEGMEDVCALSTAISCDDTANIIAGSYMVLGTRMHSLIFAAKNGVPFIAAIYDPKVNFYLSFIEMDKSGIEINALASDRFKELAALTIKKHDEISSHLLNQAERLREIVSSDFVDLKKKIDSSTLA